MLKYILSFLAGCLAMVSVGVVVVFYRSHRTTTARATRVDTPVATVRIHVSENPDTLLPVTDVSAMLDRIAGLTEAEKKQIRDGVSSGLVTEVQLWTEGGGEFRSVTVPVRKGGVLIRSGSKANFGPAKLILERPGRPNQTLDPTTRVVAPPDSGLAPVPPAAAK